MEPHHHHVCLSVRALVRRASERDDTIRTLYFDFCSSLLVPRQKMLRGLNALNSQVWNCRTLCAVKTLGVEGRSLVEEIGYRARDRGVTPVLGRRYLIQWVFDRTTRKSRWCRYWGCLGRVVTNRLELV